MKHTSKFGPLRLGLFTQGLVKPVFKNRGLLEGKIITHWSQIVGDQISKIALAEKITFPKGQRSDGTLHMVVTSSGALLIQYAQDLILERVNTFFGYKALTKLRLAHGLIPKTEENKPGVDKPLSTADEDWVQSHIESIEDEELKSYLQALGRAVL